jgi:hypothetical protein
MPKRKVVFFAGERLTSYLSKLAFFMVMGFSLCDSVHPSSPLPRWAATLKFVIPTEADPDFLLRGTEQQPRVRLSVSRIKFANATKFDRKSGVAQGRDLQFYCRAQRMRRGPIACGFRFSVQANCRFLPSARSGRDDKVKSGAPPW